MGEVMDPVYNFWNALWDPMRPFHRTATPTITTITPTPPPPTPQDYGDTKNEMQLNVVSP